MNGNIGGRRSSGYVHGNNEARLFFFLCVFAIQPSKVDKYWDPKVVIRGQLVTVASTMCLNGNVWGWSMTVKSIICHNEDVSFSMMGTLQY